MPTLKLLGSPLLEQSLLPLQQTPTSDSKLADPIYLPIKQPLLFMSYLALSGEWISRDVLLTVFWPEESEAKARHNLSQLLYHCKKLKWVQVEDFAVEKQRVRWLIDSDINAFREAIADNKLEDAIELYAGKLLEPVTTSNSLTYDAWLEHERQALHSMWRDAVIQYSQSAKDKATIDSALKLLHQVLKEDALAENIVQCILSLSALNNKRQQGIQLFENFVATLKEELDIEPLPETIALVNELRKGTVLGLGVGLRVGVKDLKSQLIEAQSDDSKSDDSQSYDSKGDDSKSHITTLHNFPEAITAFVGRDLELAEFSGFFQEEDMRLVTIQGSGGNGKTRLSIEVAREHAKDFVDGAVFIPLAPLSSEDYIPAAILEAIGVAIGGDTPVSEQLLAHLKGREYLLIFDNFEHIIEGSSLLLDFLKASPKTKIIVTSREALGFQGEWIYQLKGLPYPKDINEVHPEIYDSVKLFLRRARHNLADFRLTDENKQSIVALCQLVEGMPLALELATGWLRLLSTEEILQEIQINLDFLEAESKDLPDRHRSLRAVFEHSWQLISIEEQTALMALSVFQDGFTKEAAKEVADTSLRTLLNLVNKSLIYKQATGRFNQLATLQAFGVSKLAEKPKLFKDYQERYCNYFLEEGKQMKVRLHSSEQALWLAKIDADHANYRAVISRFTRLSDKSALELANSIWRFWWLRGYYQEARALFKHLLNVFAYLANDPLIAEAQQAAGGLARLCEDHQASHQHFEKSIAMWEALGNPENCAAPKGNLALLCRIEGDYERADTLLSEALEIYRNSGDEPRVANTLNNMAAVAISMQDSDRAWELNIESLEIAKRIGESFIEARCLGNLAALSFDKSQYEQSLNFHKEALAIFEEMQYPVGIAVEHQALGDVAVKMGEFQSAVQYFEKSLAVFKSIEDKRGIVEILASFVTLTMKQGRYALTVRVIVACQTLHDVLGIQMMPGSIQEQAELLQRMPTYLNSLEIQEAELVAKQIDFVSVESLISEVLDFAEPEPQKIPR